MERLQKVLAQAGFGSRRACEEMISAGRVSVNGTVVTQLGTKVEPGLDVLAVDGRVPASSPRHVYLLLNKPVGYVSTTHDPQGRPTVLDLLKGQAIEIQKELKDIPRLYPVGRLDADSEGLLLLTNDGELTNQLIHPRFGLQKEYLAWVEGKPDQRALATLREGIMLDGKLTAVDEVELVEAYAANGRQRAVLRIVVHEGRKHEIRRLCRAIGHFVIRLVRVQFGPIRLGDLPAGSVRRLTDRELAALKK